MALSKRGLLGFVLCILLLTLAIRWLAFNEPTRVMAIKPRPDTTKSEPHTEPHTEPHKSKKKTEVVQRVKITAIIKPQAVDRMKKKNKARKLKRASKPKNKVKSEKAKSKRQPLRKKTTRRRRSTVAKKSVKTIKVTKRHTVEGLKLLKGKRPVPMLELDFGAIGVARYLTMMKKLGGRIFVADAEARSLLGEAVLNIEGARVSFVGFKDGGLDVGELSTTPHEIVDETIVDVILSKARHTFTGDDLRVVVILPVEREAAFIGAIEEGVSEAGLSMFNLSSFSGEYKYEATRGMSLHIKKGILRKEEKMVSLNLTLNLSSMRGEL